MSRCERCAQGSVASDRLIAEPSGDWYIIRLCASCYADLQSRLDRELLATLTR